MSWLRKSKGDTAPLYRNIERAAHAPILSDRQLILRSRDRITYVSLPSRSQIAVLILLVAGVGWLGHTSYAYLAHHEIVSAKDAVIDARKQANLKLRQDLNAARRQFAEVTDSLEKNHKGLVSLIGQNRTLEGNIRKFRSELSRIESERNIAESGRIELTQRLAAMEAQLHRSQARNQRLSADLEGTGAQLADALSDRSKATRRGVALSERASSLQSRLALLRDSQAGLLDRLSGTAQSEVVRLEGILKSTGMNVGRFLKKQGIGKTAQGGPFEAAKKLGKGEARDGTDVAMVDANGLLDRLEGLQGIVRSLPLMAPLDYYYISSKYGRRKDPVNGKIAMHRGLDFGAKHQATVFSTAPGVVKFAGWKGHFGRLVEIDHGNGVVTRYGHLKRIYVKRGQEIGHRTKVGKMGSSGRSTGTHLHYEIHINGASVDPFKFLKAGQNVFKG